MYIGEMILLSGNLYKFGNGFLFDGLGGIAALICIAVNHGKLNLRVAAET